MTQNKKVKIAVTGGIGSGKSTVMKHIAEKGYRTFSCDEIYKDLLKESDFVKKITDSFGDVLDSFGNLDRKRLSKIVFGDEVKLHKLNSITHPAIMERAIMLMNEYDISFIEVPLLFENGFEKLFDSVIVVLRNKDERISAVMQRDRISEEEALSRINSQCDYENVDFTKYYVIHNMGNCALLKRNTEKVLAAILSN